MFVLEATFFKLPITVIGLTVSPQHTLSEQTVLKVTFIEPTVPRNTFFDSTFLEATFFEVPVIDTTLFEMVPVIEFELTIPRWTSLDITLLFFDLAVSQITSIELTFIIVSVSEVTFLIALTVPHITFFELIVP